MEKLAACVDLKEIKELPFEVAATFSPKNVVGKGYPWWTAEGDTNAFFALFFDNLATQLSLAGMAIGAVGLPADFVWEKFFGGVGISIFFGNVFYALQASKVAMRTGKMDTCTQPYGINTPGAVAATFGVLGPVFWATGDAQKAWETACVANFFGGAFEFLGAFVAPLLVQHIPQPALLVPIGGIGLTWLGVNPFLSIFSSHDAQNPIVGFLPFIICWVAFFAAPKKGLFGKFVPTFVVVAAVGILLNLLAHIGHWKNYESSVKGSTDHLKWNGFGVPGWGQASVAFEEYGSLIMGLAFSNFMGTFACNISARKGGDVFPVMESMMADGLGTMLGGVFGSPYGTTVYIGHVTYKQLGATRGYSILNGLIFLLAGPLGLHALINAIVPHEIVAGVLVVIGLSMASQTIASAPTRWYPAVLLGLGICFADYIVGGMQSPNNDIMLLCNGYIWLSCFVAWLLMMLTDRWFLAAAGVCVVLAFSSCIGLIHAAKMSVTYDERGTLKGSEGVLPGTSGMPGWKMSLTYAMSALLCLAFHFAQKKGLIEAPEPEDFREVQAREVENLGADGTEPADRVDTTV